MKEINVTKIRALAVVLIVGLCVNTAVALDGSGTQEDPWRIKSLEDFNDFAADANYWAGFTRLETDVNLAGLTYSTAVIAGFTGVFDGNDHKIIGLTIDDGGVGNDFIGLFAGIQGGEVRNLGLEGVSVSVAGGCVGSLMGVNSGIVSNCYSTGDVSGFGYVGGLVGWNRNGSVSNCYSTGDVNGVHYIGGLVGENNNGAISDCNSIGNVTGDHEVGGLIGFNINSGTITSCHSSASVSGNENIGGVVGVNRDGSIHACYSAATVSGADDVGGLVGENTAETTNCYSMGNVSGRNRVGMLVGRNHGPIITCYSTGDITGIGDVGGLVGGNWSGGAISNCYSDVNVTGIVFVGGLVGSYRKYSQITNCYSTGSVEGGDYVGGLIGINEDQAVMTSFWDVNTSGQTTSAGGRGLTTSEMQTAYPFFLCWGYEDVWTSDEGNDYPRLMWENKPGQPIPKFSDVVAGTGTENEPYLMYTAEELNILGLSSCEWDKHFKLMADIDLSAYTNTQFNIISNESNPFTGVFDGNDHTISNFSYTVTDADNIGLFGWVDGPNATIKDLGLVDPNVEVLDSNQDDGRSYSDVGSLVGWLRDGTLSGCYVKGGSVSGVENAGGLVGGNYGGSFSNCYSTCSVSGNRYVGGLMGYNHRGIVSNCYSTGDVSGDWDVGGLVGWNLGSDGFWGIVSNCYSTGDVSGDWNVGGMVGVNYLGIVSNCYSIGSVSSDTQIGGLAGYNWGGISNCYSTGDVTGNDIVGGLVGCHDGYISNCYSTSRITGSGDYLGGLVGGDEDYCSYTACFWNSDVNPDVNGIGNRTEPNVVGKTTAQMQTKNTFTSAGWDFVGETANGTENIWSIHETVDYPKLVWKLVNFVGWDGVDFRDYSHFSGYWLDSNCGSVYDCDGVDLDFSNKVDGVDLKIFCDHWLEGKGN